MKKLFLLSVLLISCIAANAISYRVKYNVTDREDASFIVIPSHDKVVINNDTFSLRRLGTITSSGLTFNSFCYGQNDNMLCISTSSIMVEDLFKKVTGFVIMIDNKAYLADKIN